MNTEVVALTRPAERLLAKMLVLVVDSDPFVQRTASAWLCAQGAVSDHVRDVQGGIGKLLTARRAYDAVLVDGHLPDAPFRAALALRGATPRGARTVLIGMSEGGHPPGGTFDEYVGKPLHLTELVSSILWHAPRTRASGRQPDLSVVQVPPRSSRDELREIDPSGVRAACRASPRPHLQRATTRDPMTAEPLNFLLTLKEGRDHVA